MTRILSTSNWRVALVGLLTFTTLAVAWAAAPCAPSNLRVDNVWRQAADLKWCDNSTNEAEFRIAISTDRVHWDHKQSTPPNCIAARVTDLCPNTTDYFEVRAANCDGYSDYTNIVSLKTKP